MSRHQAYRNYDYENDLDEYDGAANSDENEELSAEDQGRMTSGTAAVRGALKDQSSRVSTQQIQEALWHYYYDVDKSVAYLTSKCITPSTSTAQNPKHQSRTGGNRLKKQAFTAPGAQRSSLSDFFHDMPWLDVPKDRETVFVEPLQLPLGLLGGASVPGKRSKLQALAAQRKKKAEEHEANESNQSSSARLPDRTKENIAPSTAVTGAKPKRMTNLVETEISVVDDNRPSSDQARSTPQRRNTADSTAKLNRLELPRVSVTLEPAAPSAFARALLIPAKVSATTLPTDRHLYPYMSFVSSVTNAFSGPSPDDVVLTAQSKASNKKLASTSTTKKKAGAADKDDLLGSIKDLKVDDTPLPKSKNLDVSGEFERSKSKKNTSFVVVGKAFTIRDGLPQLTVQGHVDAGKSTLMGRLLVELGVIDQRTIQRYRKEAESIGKSSFALAWVLDQRSEERARGVTIDVATNKFETDKTSFTILDAPGHRDFIPNMIAGASQADFAILVVDATTGAFEAGLRGQTREHSLLLRSMGVSRIIVAINKLDTVGWSQERFDEISQQVSGFLSATGFQLKNVSFVPVSGLYGDNMVKRSADAAVNWYSGRTLLEELEAAEPMTRALHKPLRLTISEVFRSTQSPLSISGRIDAGSLQAGDALLIQPSGEKAYVKSLELDSEPVDWAVAGQNVVIHLSNIDAIHVRVGDIVCDPKQPIGCIDTFTVKVLAFDILMPMQVDVHRGRLHAAGQVAEIAALLDKVKGTVLKKKPKIVKPASVARVVVKMGSKVPLEAGQRVVLRTGGETVAAGLLE